MTADGFISWGPHRFADPTRGVYRDPAHMTDGWYAWSTPDGEPSTICANRHGNARRSEM